jgi:hypothetical protein
MLSMSQSEQIILSVIQQLSELDPVNLAIVMLLWLQLQTMQKPPHNVKGFLISLNQADINR